ncbi:hypothetical protein P3W45_000043 [Vairimorpha bombi]|jgi:hypothetical protein
MHEIIFQTKKYKIIAYLKNKEGTKISIPKCVEIRSNDILSCLKDFTSSENLFFSKVSLTSYDNLLYLLIIDFCHIKNIRTVLNKIFPTVFDTKTIKKINKKMYLYNNRHLIRELATKILGSHQVIKDMWKEIKCIGSWSDDNFCEDEIFEEEVVFHSDELIDF